MHIGDILDALGDHVGTMWDPVLDFVEALCATRQPSFGSLLFSSFWVHPSYSGSAGARVSAYNYCY